MGKMKEQLPEIEIRYESDEPQVLVPNEVTMWAVELAVRSTKELRDEGEFSYMKRVEARAVGLLHIVGKFESPENAE